MRGEIEGSIVARMYLHMCQTPTRQLSRPDKSGNSRFEYTKILNDAHAGTLSGLAPASHMRRISMRQLSRVCSSICVNFSSRRVGAHMCQIYFPFAPYALNFQKTDGMRYNFLKKLTNSFNYII